MLTFCPFLLAVSFSLDGGDAVFSCLRVTDLLCDLVDYLADDVILVKRVLDLPHGRSLSAVPTL